MSTRARKRRFLSRSKSAEAPRDRIDRQLLVARRARKRELRKQRQQQQAAGDGTPQTGTAVRTRRGTTSKGAPAAVNRAPRRPSKVELAQLAAQQRRRAQRRRVLMARARVGMLALGVVVAIFLVREVPQLGIFKIQDISVSGTSAVPDILVRNTIDKSLRNATLFDVNTGELETELQQLPFVKSATVHRRVPNGLEITIVEYEPLALGVSNTGSWLVARDGRVLSRARLVDWLGRVPVVRLEHNNVKAGDRVGGEPALMLLRTIQPGINGSFRSIEVSDRGVIATLSDGPEIRLGQPDQLSQKIMVAERLLGMFGHAKQGSIDYVDVSVPARPAVKMGVNSPPTAVSTAPQVGNPDSSDQVTGTQQSGADAPVSDPDL